MRRCHITALLLLALAAGPGARAAESDHREFDAMLYAPYQSDAAGPSAARTFTLAFEYPLAQADHQVGWRLDLLGRAGAPLRQWRGALRLRRDPVSVKVRWDGQAGAAALPAGRYQVRLRATTHAPGGADEVVEQAWEIWIGPRAAPAMPAFQPLPGAQPAIAVAPAPASLPYTVYLGNLHSQTGHSDGGGDLATCSGAQDPQSSKLGPAEAYAYALGKGLDILVASEHNHMYDGSAGANPDADPAAAHALYQSGLAAAAGFSADHPGFLALYGLEWGVINGGGHMNIFNTPELLGWERNSASQLIADTDTPRSDYAALYTLMREKGWVGQFNHPALNGQFMVGGVPLGYSADGDAAMALCEVVNTNAFSANTSETEARRSNFEMACNKALEAGYHLAFSSDQDNHCANWGASYTNRTALLIPRGVALSRQSFIDALKARRVFATMDKTAQLVLTANGHMMGERFANSGVLDLVAHFASSAGKSVASVSILEGVPGRNGTVSELSTTAITSITPAPGEHFYYARLTEDDGNILWSAPVWISQAAPPLKPAR